GWTWKFRPGVTRTKSTPGQPCAHGPGRLLADRLGELVRQIQGGGQFGAPGANRIESRLLGGSALLRPADPLEGQLSRGRSCRSRRRDRVATVAPLPGRAQPLP